VSGARWHADDFQNYLLTSRGESWQSFIFPAISEGPDKDPLGRPAGTPLCPRFTLEALEKKRQAVGEAVWMAQYQQSPLPESESGVGIVFSKEVIAKITASPLCRLSGSSSRTSCKTPITYIALDAGLKTSHSAYCVIERVETEIQNEPEFHILDLRRYELGKAIHSIVQELNAFSMDPVFEVAPVFIVDGSGQGGQILVEIMRREQIVPVIPLVITSHGSSRHKYTVLKADLVENFLDLVLAGRVKIVADIPARDLLFEELRSYRSKNSPQGRTVTYSPAGGGHDDILDSVMLATYAGVQGWAPLYRHTAGTYGRVSRRWISGNRGYLERNLGSLNAEGDSDYVDSEGCAS